jgi:hypothetical protein
MSLLNWFSGKSDARHEASAKAQADRDSSGLTRGDRGRPVGGRGKSERGEKAVDSSLKGAAAHAERSGGHKSHRHAKREQLYAAVREAMLRAGVLSASYTFKVLSLDPRGDQFMVMMDLAQELGGQAERLAEMEVMIAQGAKSRYNIRVTAVYWRMHERVSVGRPQTGTQTGSATPHAQATQAARAALPASLLPRPAGAGPTPAAPRYEPIQADEVAAFKHALVAASAQGAAPAEQGVSTRSGPRSYTLLTGFEDTEMPDSPASSPALSATQYGDLN